MERFEYGQLASGRSCAHVDGSADALRRHHPSGPHERWTPSCWPSAEMKKYSKILFSRLSRREKGWGCVKPGGPTQHDAMGVELFARGC